MNDTGSAQGAQGMPGVQGVPGVPGQAAPTGANPFAGMSGGGIPGGGQPGGSTITFDESKPAADANENGKGKGRRSGKADRTAKAPKKKSGAEALLGDTGEGVILKPGAKFVLYKGKKSKPALIARSLRALVMVLRVGESEANALEIVGEQFHKYEIGRAYTDAAKRMREEGASMKQALLVQDVVPKTVKELVAASATSQSMIANLEESAVLVAESESVKKKLLNALIQPAFMAALTTVFLFTGTLFIIPGFVELFAQFGTETPPLTLIVLRIADVLTWILGILIGSLLLFAAFWFAWGRRNDNVRRLVSVFALKVPAIGSILQLSATSRLFQLLSANLKTGIAEPEALTGAANGCGNEAIRQHAINHAEAMLREGKSLREFAKSNLMPFDARHILGSAPSVSQEIKVMEDLAPEYRKEANVQVEALSRTLEPLMNYIVYGVAGFLIIAIMLPMYSIYPSMMEYTTVLLAPGVVAGRKVVRGR